MNMKIMFASAVLVICATSFGQVTPYGDFGSYDAAVGGQHDQFINFETDFNGNPIGALVGDADGNGTLDTLGSNFSLAIVYSSPDATGFTAYVNMADIDQGIDFEAGPMGSWAGHLNIAYDDLYSASGLTCIACTPNTVISLYDGTRLVGVVNPFNSNTFQFIGWTVEGDCFNRVELNGSFYAIDAHYSTECAGSGSPRCTYEVRAVKRKSGTCGEPCVDCPYAVGDLVCAADCMVDDDCRSSLKGFNACTGGGSCKIKANLVGCLIPDNCIRCR